MSLLNLLGHFAHDEVGSGAGKLTMALRAFGFTIPAGARQFVPHVRALVQDAEAPLPTSLRQSLDRARRRSQP